MSNAEILLVGAGAVGSLLASAMMQNGVAFDWYIRNPEVRSQARGLELRLPDRQLRPSQALVSYLQRQPKSRYPTVITSVKSQQTENLMAALPLASMGRRLAVANGLIRGDYHLGLLYGGAFLDGNVLVTRTSNILRIGGLGSIVDDSEWFSSILACDWLACSTEQGIEVLQWHKLCLNCVVNPITAMLDITNGSLLAMLGSPLVTGLIHELQAVAHRHLGSRWTYGTSSIHEGVVALIEATHDNSSSMREDLRLGREPETSHMNGAIARLGREYGIPCPLNAALSEMIIELAAGSRKPG